MDCKDLEARALSKGRERSAPNVLEIHEAIRVEGQHELSRPVQALAVSGLAAGLCLGFSFLAQASLQHALPEADWTPLVTKFGYSVGFLIVILGRQQLFTENTLTPILTFFSSPTRKVAQRVARLWLIVLLANLAGASIFAAFLALTPVFSHEMGVTLSKVALSIFEPGAYANFLRGILGGWLIALLVWLLPFAETARPWIIIVMTYMIGIGHLAHVIAGSVEAFYAVFIGTLSLGAALSGFIIPALIGNVLGGVALVSALHHAQIRFDANHGEDGSDVVEAECQTTGYLENRPFPGVT